MAGILNLGAVKRSVVVLLGFQVLRWLVFGISYMLNRGSWVEVAAVEASTAAVGGWWSTFFFILLSILFICVLCRGNILVRFGSITPGLLVLPSARLSLLAGWRGPKVLSTISQCGRSEPAVLEDRALGDISLCPDCAVTLPKSLLVADTFPAKQWSETRRLRDIALSPAETGIVVLGCLMLIAAALIETNAILG